MSALSTPARRSAASGSAPPLRRMSSSGGLSCSRVICRARCRSASTLGLRATDCGEPNPTHGPVVEDECSFATQEDGMHPRPRARFSAILLTCARAWDTVLECVEPRIRSARTDACARPERMRRAQLRRPVTVSIPVHAVKSGIASVQCWSGCAPDSRTLEPVADGEWVAHSPTRVRPRSPSPRASVGRSSIRQRSTSSGRSARRRPDLPRSNSSSPEGGTGGGWGGGTGG